jgi:hypothetical protein
MAAGRAQIPTWTAADLPSLQPPAAVQNLPSSGAKDPPSDGDWPPLERKLALRRLYQETSEAACEFIPADSPAAAGRALADKLREAKLI